MEDIRQKLHLNHMSLMDKNIDFKDIWYTLLAEKKIIIIVMLVAFVLGVVYSLTIVPQYQSSILLQIEGKQSGVDLGGMGLGALGKQTNSAADIQATLIKSRFILVPTVETLGLNISIRPHYLPIIGRLMANHNVELTKPFLHLNKYAWGGEKLEISNFKTTSHEILKLVAKENNTFELFTRMGKKILIGKVGELSKIKDENLAISILVKKLKANIGTEFFISESSPEKIADSIAAGLQVSDLGKEYQLDKTGVLQILLKNSNPQYVVDLLNEMANIAIHKDIERKTKEAEKTLFFLENQLPIIQASLNKIEKELDQHRMKSGTIDVNIKTKMLMRQLADVQREIEKVNLNRIMLMQKYTEIHPYVSGLHEKKRALQDELQSLEKQFQTLPASDQIAVKLMRDISVKNLLYRMILNKIQEYKIIKASTMSEIRILHPAQLPDTALPSGKSFIIIVSILLGFIVGSLIVITKKLFRNLVEDPNWLEQRFGIPTFAIVPYSAQQKLNIQSYQNQLNDLSILSQTQPRDLSIEALRSLRTSLQFALMGAKNNIISILGISPGIGKSFVSVNFSYILADSNKKVLLIDGDIRKGYLQNYFKLKRSPGLSEVIQGNISLASVIQKTSHNNLDFIASGEFPSNPSELLMGKCFKDVLLMLSSQYDLIIIDTAPILAVTDGVIVGSESGVNFLVIANNMHQADEIDVAIKRLKNNKVVVQGVIYNNIKSSKTIQRSYAYAYGETEK